MENQQLVENQQVVENQQLVLHQLVVENQQQVFVTWSTLTTADCSSACFS